MKKVLVVVLVLVLAGAGMAAYMWNKPHKTVDDEQGIAVDAVALFNEFTANEQAANSKYLNKAVTVTGVVSTVDENQDKKKYVVLQTEDALSGVMCTMRDNNAIPQTGQKVTIKGFCSGFTSDVKLTDCMVAEPAQ